MTQEKALYSRLRDLRQQLAIRKGLPEYYIFTNKTLEEMASSMPTTEEELVAVYGVGKTKQRQYGELFLAEILSFREENNITEPFSLPQRTSTREQNDSSLLDIVVVYPKQEAEAITIDNFEVLKAFLQELLGNYEQILYTPDQLKKAKQDKATLNKMKKAIAARRKEIKDICLEPFYAVDAQLKELQQMIDIPLVRIAEFTSEMDQVQKDTKSANIKMYYDQIANNLGPMADSVFVSDWFYNKKWENKTTPDWRWQSEIRQKIEIIAQDIRELSDIAGDNSAAVIAKYVETGNKDLAIRFLHSITAIIIEDKEPEPSKPSNIISVPPVDIKPNKDQYQQTSEMLIKITGTTEQQQAVIQYLKERGVKYEVFVGLFVK